MSDEPPEIIPPEIRKTPARIAEEYADEGLPEPLKDVGGRPAHQPTDATRAVVALLVAFKFPHWKIAHYLGLKDERTIRKHYAEELEHGDIKIKAMVIGAWAKNVQAGKEMTILRYMETEVMRPDLPPPPPDQEEKPVTRERVRDVLKQLREEF